MFVGVAGFKPTMTDPNSVVLSVTPYPIVFLKLTTVLTNFGGIQVKTNHFVVKKPIIKKLKPKTIY